MRTIGNDTMPSLVGSYSGCVPRPPSTRFQGSKFKLLDWIWEHLESIPFQTCLDAFGGSASFSHFLKGKGKSVTCNDLLVSGYLNGVALVENQQHLLSEADIERIIRRRQRRDYDDLISRTFDGIYFTADENAWLDLVSQNIATITNRYKQAIAYYALFQSALAKRPYNLFHRRNLYMRFAKVTRTFGNKTTWDKPFEEHFCQFAQSANAAVFKGAPCRAINEDAINVAGEYDLVYIDPPYVNQRGVGVDYHGFYHFLEGLAEYENWAARIDFSSKHRRLHRITSPWTNRATIHQAFADLFQRFHQSTLVVSYRSDGIPPLDELTDLLRQVKRKVAVHMVHRGYKYALSTNTTSSEALLIGRD